MITIRPWDDADDVIGWKWVEESWTAFADDDQERSMDAFFGERRRRHAIFLGVWRDEDLVGLLICEPFTRHCCMAYCVFRRRSTSPSETDRALNLGYEFAWKLGYRRIWAWVHQDNVAMQRALKRTGAVFEGVLYALGQRDGRPANVVSFALLRPPANKL